MKWNEIENDFITEVKLGLESTTTNDNNMAGREGMLRRSHMDFSLEIRTISLQVQSAPTDCS